MKGLRERDRCLINVKILWLVLDKGSDKGDPLTRLVALSHEDARTIFYFGYPWLGTCCRTILSPGSVTWYIQSTRFSAEFLFFFSFSLHSSLLLFALDRPANPVVSRKITIIFVRCRRFRETDGAQRFSRLLLDLTQILPRVGREKVSAWPWVNCLDLACLVFSLVR